MPPTLRSLAMAELDWAEWKGEKQPSGAAQQIADVLSANKKTQPSEYLDQMHPLPNIQDIDIAHAMGLGKKTTANYCNSCTKGEPNKLRLPPSRSRWSKQAGIAREKTWRINSGQIFETREFNGS
jgi:hypothetical protein